jgi:hypothetical protein
MTTKYLVTAMTMHDGEASELRVLGIPVTTTNGVQDKTSFEVEMTAEEIAAVRAHPAVLRIQTI